MSYQLVKRKTIFRSRECGACNKTITAGVDHYVADVNGNKAKETPLCEACHALYQSRPHNIPCTITLESNQIPCTSCNHNCGGSKWIFKLDGVLVCGPCFISWANCERRSVHECDYEPSFDKIFCRSCFRVMKPNQVLYTCKTHKRGFCQQCWNSQSGYSLDVDLKHLETCTPENIYNLAKTHQRLRAKDKAYKLFLFAAIFNHHESMLQVLEYSRAANNTTSRHRVALKQFASTLASVRNYKGYLSLAHIYSTFNYEEATKYYRKALPTKDVSVYRWLGKDYCSQGNYKSAYEMFSEGLCQAEIMKMPIYKCLQQVGLHQHIHNFYLSGIVDPASLKRIALDNGFLNQLRFLSVMERKALADRYAPRPCMCARSPGSVACGGCGGQGCFRCPNCFGTGVWVNVPCLNCQGSGMAPCWPCGKSGRRPCPNFHNCKGTGRVFPQ